MVEFCAHRKRHMQDSANQHELGRPRGSPAAGARGRLRDRRFYCCADVALLNGLAVHRFDGDFGYCITFGGFQSGNGQVAYLR